MPERAVFRPRNASLNQIYRLLYLYVFALFMVGGNFFRFIQIQGLPSSFSIIEAILYLLSIPIYLSSVRKSLSLVIVIFTYSLYGVLLNGFDLPSVLYSFKLVGMIFAGVALGDTLIKERAAPFLIKIYVALLFGGVIIFFLFPRAEIFFALLEGYGVHFTGDPHVRRFISPLFDPNYYAAIACVPMILTWQMREKKSHFYLSILFFFSILLTFSRSGIATAFGVIFFGGILEKKKQSLKLLLILPAALIFHKELGYLINRTIHIFDDPSALHRLRTLKYGLRHFLELPLFGIGYNFIPAYLQQESGLLGIDSSLLTTLITFGLIPTLCALFFGILWSFKRWKTFSPTHKWLYIYLAISILFTSQFNNLLYYQFWLIPMIALWGYENENRINS